MTKLNCPPWITTEGSQLVYSHSSSRARRRSCCQGRNVINPKRRAENDPIARIVNAGILTAGYGLAEISTGGAV